MKRSRCEKGEGEMKPKTQGEWIKGTYRVVKAFPFVIGTLYFTELRLDSGDVATRFIHALDIEPVRDRIRVESVFHRDEIVFFPVRDAFVEEDVLYQVFHRMEGTLLAHHLSRCSPLPFSEGLRLIRRIVNHLRRLYDQRQFTLVHPQNMVLTTDRSLRFLYGGRLGFLPKGVGMDFSLYSPDQERDMLYDSYTLGVLIYQILTGNNPMGQGLTITPLSTVRRDCPPELNELVMRSFSFDMGKRPRIEEYARLLNWLA
jgi:hypothetical protein